MKPGENTNRGCGIQVSRDLNHIKTLIQTTHVNGHKRSYIIQKYIERPLLYKNRKFDIRCYALTTTVNGNLQGYWYTDGYLRTACREYNLKNATNRMIHLTNDAVQKKSEDYGKFEAGNRVSLTFMTSPSTPFSSNSWYKEDIFSNGKLATISKVLDWKVFLVMKAEFVLI